MLLCSISICAQNRYCLLKTLWPEMELQGWGIAGSFKSQDLSGIALYYLLAFAFLFHSRGERAEVAWVEAPLGFLLFSFLRGRFPRSHILWSWTASKQISQIPVYNHDIVPRKVEQPHSTWLPQPASSAYWKWEGMEPELPLLAACCFSSWKGEVSLWVPAGLSSSCWSAFFDRAATTRGIGGVFVWFWTVGFLFVLSLFFVLVFWGEFLWSWRFGICVVLGFFLSFSSLCPHVVERRGRAATIFVSPHVIVHGGRHLGQRVFSAIFRFSLFPGSL